MKPGDYYLLIDHGEEWDSMANGVIWVYIQEGPHLPQFRAVSPLGNPSTEMYRNKNANFIRDEMRKI